MTAYLTTCNQCRRTTSRQYARMHSGQCKSCAEPEAAPTRKSARHNDESEYERQIARMPGGDLYNEYHGYGE